MTLFLKGKHYFLKGKIFLASCCFTDFGVYRKMPFYKSSEKKVALLTPFVRVFFVELLNL